MCCSSDSNPQPFILTGDLWCNQAKDRPCNNCIRRYPAVECIYESTSYDTLHEQFAYRLTSARPPAIAEQRAGDRAHSQYDQQVSPLSHPMGDHSRSPITNTGYAQPPNTPYNTTFVSTTQTDSYFPITYSSLTNSTSRPFYHQSANSETSSTTSNGPSYVATTSAGNDYLMDDDGTYYGGADPGYGGAYYGDVSQVNQGTWVTTQGDVTGFTGPNTSSGGDYYYAHVADQHHIGTTRG